MRGTALAALALASALSGLAPCSAAELLRPILDVEPRGPAAEALRRAETRAGALLSDQALPFSTAQAAAFLADRSLSPFDSLLLLERHPFGGGELLHWSDAARGNSFFASPILELGAAGGAGDDTLGTSGYYGLGGRIQGLVGGRLAYSTHAVVYAEKADSPRFAHQFDPDFGETYSVEQGLTADTLFEMRTFNRFEYSLRYDGGWWSLKAGRDRVHLGPGRFSTLTASGDTPPYYLLAGHIDFAPWLSLDDYALKMTDTQHDILKYANVHRFEFKPTRSLELAFQDIVIYQDRDPDPTYLIPLVPLTFAEANGGGRDNAAMAFDFRYASPFGLSAWGELFLDDLMGPGSFFDPFWENRWASLAGFQWTLPTAWADADLVAEYSHVEPWTYNGRKPQTSFRHFDVPSASKLGPDSRSVDVVASLRAFRGFEWREHGELNEKGVDRGATLGTIHVDSLDGQRKEWLGPGSRTQWVITHELGYYWRRFLYARGRWSQVWEKGLSQRFGADLEASW